MEKELKNLINTIDKLVINQRYLYDYLQSNNYNNDLLKAELYLVYIESNKLLETVNEAIEKVSK